MEIITTSDDLMNLFASCFSHFLPDAAKIKEDMADIIKGKRSNFQGNAYTEELEKNVVYLCEVRVYICSAITEFLMNMDARLPGDAQMLRSLFANYCNPTNYHLAYIRTDCLGCEVHSEHHRYDALRTLRSAGITHEYTKRVEEWYEQFQWALVAAGSIYDILMQNPQYAGSANSMRIEDVFTVTEKHIIGYGSLMQQKVDAVHRT
jgi:hypothetical protein